jgi:hypothetical protein
MITLTRKEAQQVLDAFENFCEYGAILKPLEVRDLLRARIAQPEPDAAYGYASRLAEAIYQKHYRQDSPEWKPLDDTLGVLTQIDNMTCRLVKAQPEPEPVAWVDWDEHGDAFLTIKDCGVPLYTAPPQREWQGLTDEEIKKEQHHIDWTSGHTYAKFARAIEAKLKEKNT